MTMPSIKGTTNKYVTPKNNQVDGLTMITAPATTNETLTWRLGFAVA